MEQREHKETDKSYLEDLVTFIRLHLYNRGVSCGAQKIQHHYHQFGLLEEYSHVMVLLTVEQVSTLRILSARLKTRIIFRIIIILKQQKRGLTITKT
jgi:hypothetical protein